MGKILETHILCIWVRHNTFTCNILGILWQFQFMNWHATHGATKCLLVIFHPLRGQVRVDKERIITILYKITKIQQNQMVL